MRKNRATHPQTFWLTFAVAFATGLSLWLALAMGLAVQAQDAQVSADISEISVMAVPWSAQEANTTPVTGVVTLDGQPVVDAQVRVGGYRLPELTDAQGQFTYPVDRNLVRRQVVTVSDAANATVDGSALSDEQQAALEEAQGSIDVHFEVVDVVTTLRDDGTTIVSGTVQFANGQPPPPVVLYSYRLTGTVTNSNGEPIEGVTVGTASPEFRWSFSEPTGPQGIYTSFFWPTTAAPFSVLLIEGSESYPVEGEQDVLFPIYQSAHMDVTLDRSSGTITVTEPAEIEGLIYDGLLVGVMQDGAPVRPLSVTWPDEQGHFEIVLPASMQGETLQWWQRSGYYFSTTPAEPGGEISLGEWPTQFDSSTPRGFGTLELPE